ncbi:hypothetical protein C8F01DRAFT_1084444 [Mycena amicta]|nr:hypothetical protein C8F01DRAFT_1084444 [Mycena amicta]
MLPMPFCINSFLIGLPLVAVIISHESFPVRSAVLFGIKCFPIGLPLARPWIRLKQLPTLPNSPSLARSLRVPPHIPTGPKPKLQRRVLASRKLEPEKDEEPLMEAPRDGGAWTTLHCHLLASTTASQRHALLCTTTQTSARRLRPLHDDSDHPLSFYHHDDAIATTTSPVAVAGDDDATQTPTVSPVTVRRSRVAAPDPLALERSRSRLKSKSSSTRPKSSARSSTFAVRRSVLDTSSSLDPASGAEAGADDFGALVHVMSKKGSTPRLRLTEHMVAAGQFDFDDDEPGKMKTEEDKLAKNAGVIGQAVFKLRRLSATCVVALGNNRHGTFASPKPRSRRWDRQRCSFSTCVLNATRCFVCRGRSMYGRHRGDEAGAGGEQRERGRTSGLTRGRCLERVDTGGFERKPRN